LINIIFKKYFELVFWIAALTALAIANPNGQAHFSLCPLNLMGFTWCPGCGLGHAIIFLFHGQFVRSFHAHWLGIPAVLIILYRVYTILTSRFYFPVNANSNLW